MDMSTSPFNILCSSTQHSKGLDEIIERRSHTNQDEDLATIYSFKKEQKVRLRKVTPVSKKMSPLPNCRVQAGTSHFWSLEEENEDFGSEDLKKTTDCVSPKILLQDVEALNERESDSELAENDEEAMDYICTFPSQACTRPASFSDYTEKALEMRIRQEMERKLSGSRPFNCSGSGNVSPLLRRAVIGNTLNVRKTTVDSGFSDDCDCEIRIEDIDGTSFMSDATTSDDEYNYADNLSQLSTCASEKRTSKNRPQRRRKVTPIPCSTSINITSVRKCTEGTSGVACISLEEEDFEDVNNFNSDDDFVNMGVSPLSPQKQTHGFEDSSHELTVRSEWLLDTRVRSVSFTGDRRNRENNVDSPHLYLKPHPRRRKRAVTLIPSTGELRKCRDSRNQNAAPTPDGKSSEGSINESSSSSLDYIPNTLTFEHGPGIKVQIDDDSRDIDVNLIKTEAEDEDDKGPWCADKTNALGNLNTNQKSPTRRKLTPVGIGPPCLDKMKELREQMTGLHVQEDDENGDPKLHGNSDY